MNLEQFEFHDQVRGYQVFRRIIVSDPCNKPSSQCSINNIPPGHSQIHTWSPMLLRLITGADDTLKTVTMHALCSYISSSKLNDQTEKTQSSASPDYPSSEEQGTLTLQSTDELKGKGNQYISPVITRFFPRLYREVICPMQVSSLLQMRAIGHQ